MPVDVVHVPYEYDGTIDRVVDGDTVVALLTRSVDFGFGIVVTQTHPMQLRLYGINAPEMKTAGGPPARQHLIALLGGEAELRFAAVLVKTVKDRKEKFGRYLATLIVGGANVNDRMVADGHAVPYFP